MKRMTTAQLDALQAAARSGDRAKLRRAARDLRRDAHLEGFREAYAWAMGRVAERIRADRPDLHASNLLPWLDGEARRS